MRLLLTPPLLLTPLLRLRLLWPLLKPKGLPVPTNSRRFKPSWPRPRRRKLLRLPLLLRPSPPLRLLRLRLLRLPLPLKRP